MCASDGIKLTAIKMTVKCDMPDLPTVNKHMIRYNIREYMYMFAVA